MRILRDIIGKTGGAAVRLALILSGVAVTGAGAFAQTAFEYKGKRMETGERCLLVDKERAGKDAFIFASPADALHYVERENAAASHYLEKKEEAASASRYSEKKKAAASHYSKRKKDADTAWTEIYIMPSVYWMDNPDDDEVRRPKQGENTPYAMEVEAGRLRLIGMGRRAEDVVLACNRGQTQGADGNFTMFHFKGSHVEAADITFGNYCNVDLVYDSDPALSRPRRKDAIVQAQIAICDGDYYRLSGCRFISRLNLCPFVGGRHTEFSRCYFECTDDALCGTGIYRQCRLVLFSSKPFYTTDPECGAVFIDCDIHSKTKGTQYLTKVSGPVRMERCRWTSDDPELRIWWSKRADPRHHCVMSDCTLNGKPLDVPPATQPLPVELPPFELQPQTDIMPGAWTLDCFKPKDTAAYDWQADNSRSAWGYAEGVDGAEGSWGLVQLQKGARMMFTPSENTPVETQACTVELDPCKSGGQGFGSATGQYLDICIKFDTSTLTGYGIRFIRTPEYDRAVDVLLVEYSGGSVSPICQPRRCDLFRRGCRVTLTASGRVLTALVENAGHGSQELRAEMPRPNKFGGFHLQHTGSTGASATVVRQIQLR